ncbi:NmrA family NAD(P)-binding protein [Dyadobacter chenhuakuii]|uniref:NmrA family NAD(P)-binding protein n=1 Tax=Dyadobacter chenhuakuii TaxID=2909339 RepID=A0A9X1QB05_9BACT|nr:NmrA family NAD(P)-binding protein [Dyadobacter chenhuakuii]MCF2497172.1 NmrA family NAD(P)-binding protein [Dyadobacter chenhuakuii]
MTDITKLPEPGTIILAGATGELGFLIAGFILKRGGVVKALVRQESSNPRVSELRRIGAEIIEVDFADVDELTRACAGGTCFVSALSGLRDVIVDMQMRLLNAAVAAGIPRFIPSDFSIDFTKLPDGSNRNLDLRREFGRKLNDAPIAATSILNGMFTDLLTGQAPVVLFKIKRVLYWGNADQPMDFTTMRDTADYTAAAALDPTTPRYLRIAGDVATIRDIQRAASEATGEKFGTLRPGGLDFLGTMIKITRTLSPQNDEVFPPWQGMQYLHNMLSGKPKMSPLDNDRFADIRWTRIREVLAAR